MATPGQRVLAALQARLQKITVANGYPITVKEVLLNKGEIEFSIGADRLPLIDIIQVTENYEPESSGYVGVNAAVILRLVMPQGNTDSNMEEFKSAVVRNIYSDGYAMSGHAGVHLSDANGGTIAWPRLISCEADIALVNGNRIYALMIELHSKRTFREF
jgi:hypothetical protein